MACGKSSIVVAGQIIYLDKVGAFRLESAAEAIERTKKEHPLRRVSETTISPHYLTVFWTSGEKHVIPIFTEAEAQELRDTLPR